MGLIRPEQLTKLEYNITGSFTGSFTGDGSGLTGLPSSDPFPYTGSAIISGSLTIIGGFTASGLNYPSTDGERGDTLVTDGLGNLTFEKPTIYAQVKNKAGGTLLKGTPVHVSSSVGNLDEVIAASASVDSTMPATFVLAEDLADDQEGLAIVTGFINGINTSGFGEGDIVYVGPNGGYTNVRPTGSNKIQNLGIVTKVAVNGSGFVYGSGRANDLPNIQPGYLWVGNDDWVPTAIATSSFVGAANIPVLDEGTQITPTVSSFDFVGNGVTATAVGNAVTITIPGGTSSLFPFVGDAVITGSLEIVGSGQDLFLIKNQTNNTLLQVSQSGVVVLSTQSVELVNPAPNGGIYFTSTSFFVGLD